MAGRSAQAAQDAATIEKMSFEEAMSALEGIVGQLESGRVNLEESIALYERGAALRKHCEAKLKAAEMRVEQIIQDQSGGASGVQPANLDGAAS
ncbi:MAG: exodeoxyribonuclease VII small subunit [Neomegalonema sp.]|nr:exodeoxyribonuclease VII small subunit [Neomegalonema sp.]